MHRNVYPLAAIVGQETLKKCLFIGAVNPAAGGVLIRGEKGTAKSTAVRALADLLPEIEVAGGCPFSCDPFANDDSCPHCATEKARPRAVRRKVRVVELPLNATEDRVVGGIDFTRAVKHGRRVLSPGLLADAHRGVLYVDEVNLLDDHIVDIILDAAASGENRVEREGISMSHPSQFILVGTMNPEEGELRPQLLDRFGLCVEVNGAEDPDDRVTLMERRDAFDLDPKAFSKGYRAQSEQLAIQLAEARELLPQVRVSRHLRSFITELCSENNVAGHRADLVMEQAARALAALEMKTEVDVDHIREVAPLVLIHRRRDAAPPPPPPPPPPPEDRQSEDDDTPENQEENSKEENSQEEMEQPAQAQPNRPEPSEGDDDKDDCPPSPPMPDKGEDQIYQIGATFNVKPISTPKDRVVRRGSGRRSRTRVSQKQGRYVKSCMTSRHGDIAWTPPSARPHPTRNSAKTAMATATACSSN